MKHLYGIILLVFALTVFQSNLMAAESPKIGVLNLQKCIQECAEAKNIYEKLGKGLEEKKKVLDSKTQEYNDLTKDIEKQSLMLSAEAKEGKELKLKLMQLRIKHMMEDLEMERRSAEEYARFEILKIVQGAVEKVAQKNGLNFVAERSGLLFHTKDLDITDEVIKAMNAK